MPASTNPVIITGAAGFIGHKTTELFLNAGFKVIGIDNFDHYYDPELKRQRINHLLKQHKHKDNFTFIEGDICDSSFVKAIFARFKPAGVINLAAKAGVRNSLLKPEEYFKTNVEGHLNILKAMVEFNTKYILLASTSSIYGGLKPPFKESMIPVQPLSPYAISKLSAEYLTGVWSRIYGIKSIIVRYFTVYGPWGRPDMLIFRLIHKLLSNQPITIYGDGSQRRSFTYIDDIATGTLKAYQALTSTLANAPSTSPPVFNLGHPDDFSVNQVITTLEKISNKKVIRHLSDFHPADMPVTKADITRARQILKWNPTTPLYEGIKATWNWFVENWNWLKKIKLPE